MSKYNNKLYGVKYLKLEGFLKKRIQETKDELEKHRSNFGNNEVSYMFSLIAYKEVLDEFLKIKEKDFRFKKQRIKEIKRNEYKKRDN